tara:strand:+ start:545 stop:979 length:435 start_codon:yes stop_codon:yes gene_type:complete
MNKSELKEIIKSVVSEELKGYTKDPETGKFVATKGGTSKEYRDILTRMAKTTEAYKGDPDKGDSILDKADPKNVDRISRGEKPVYEYEQKYIVSFRVGDDDDDVEVKASSPEDAISKLKSGKVKLAYGQPLPRLARSFSAKLSK